MPNNENELNGLAWSIAAIIAGGGIIAAISYFFPMDILLSFVFWMVVPIVCLAFACGLISWGTVTAVFNGALKNKIREYAAEMRAAPAS
jgi:hypothetical protein